MNFKSDNNAVWSHCRITELINPFLFHENFQYGEPVPKRTIQFKRKQ